MRTPAMSDEELDQLFRRGAEDYPDEVSLSGWLHLSEQLDEAARQQQVRRQVRQRVAGLFALEMVLVALLFLFWPLPTTWRLGSNSPAAHSASASTAPNESATKPGVAHNPTVTTRQLRRPAAVAVLTAPSTTGPAARLRRAAGPSAPTPATAPAAKNRFTLPATKVGSSPDRSAARIAHAASVAASRAAAPGASRSISPVEHPRDTGLATESVAQNPAQSTSFAPTLNTISPATPDSVTALAQQPTVETPVAEVPDSTHLLPKRPAPAYRLLVGVVGGPELTGVAGSGPTPRLGGTVGVVAEYRLTPRWRIRTGLVRSVKRYAALGSDYNPPAGYWTWRIPVDQVDANCRILEIPLDVRYEVLTRPAYSLYASAGLTSLLMRNERYRYFYELNGSYIDRSWSLARGSNAAWRVAQLSVGIERPVGERWLLQAEPFVKLPLSGVGFGNIKLNSTGVLLGIRYSLAKPRATAP